MITNYTPDKCKYSIGKLVKSVWLVSEEAIKDIRIDNGEAWVESISETPIRLDCYSIELTDTDTLDERYKFTHTLTFSVNGYANKDDFQGRYYAIVKDDEGTYWLVNPLFPCKVTYTYTLGYEQNHTDFTMSTVSNHPVLKLNGMVDSSTYQCKDYWLDGIDALWLNEKRYTVHNGNHVMYTNGGFKTVEYNSKSATFTETFDGTNTSHGIEFDVLFSAYQKSWHYNLLEFKDNLYAAVIKTMNDKYALCGFSLGLQPGFQVSANDTNNQIDKIHITLNDAHDVGDPIEMYDSIEYEYLSAKTWVYTDEYDGWECVDEGVARYLLQMEIDALENETGNYKALDGYASRFPYLNIVDTFDNTETFENVDCGSSACRLRSSLPSQLTFNDTGCQTYYVKAGSDWEISSSVDYIRVSPSTGSADESYIVSVCNDIEPSDTVRNSSLTIDYCETSRTVDVSVVQYDGCFTQGSTYNIPANAKVMTLPSECCINTARETTYAGVNITVYQDYLQVTVPQNNTGAQRTIILLVTYCDGTTEDIIINQSDIFEKWELYGETFCVGTDLYGKEYLYTGTTPSSYVRTDTSRDVLIERFYYDCLDIRRKWEETSDTLCVHESSNLYGKYFMYKEMITYDGGETWEETGNVAPSGTPIAYFETLEDCETVVPQYRWVNSGTTCSGESLYNMQIKQVSWDYGRTWSNVIPEEYQIGSLIEKCSDDCIVPMPVVDMTGKLLVSLNEDGSIARDHNCCSTTGIGYNLLKLESASTDKCAVYTHPRYGEFGKFVYIGSCAKTAPYALRDYVLGRCGAGCGKYIYFEGGQNFNLSRGLFHGASIRKVDIGDSAMTFHMESQLNVPGATFENGCGDISEILLRTTNVSCQAFKTDSHDVLTNPPFGDTAEFNQLVKLHKEAFFWSGFKNIIFNNGLEFECFMPSACEVECGDLDDIFNIGYGAKPTITLNGPAENYSLCPCGGDIASSLRDIRCTVIDNRVVSAGFTAYYSNQQQLIHNCSYYDAGTLTSGITKPDGYDFPLMTSAIVGSCYNVISGATFAGCRSLSSVTFNGDIEEFGISTFYGCTSLTSIGPNGSGASVDIPDSVTELPQTIFSGCTGLTYIEIPSGITSIGYSAFTDCTSLTSITVDATTPPELLSMAFYNTNNCSIFVPCASLDVYIEAPGWSSYASRILGIPPCGQPTFNTKWGATYADSHTVSAACDASSAITNGEISLTGLVTVEVGDCVTSIGSTAFSRCNTLETITIPDSVTSIGSSAFTYCSSLTSVTIGSGVTFIGTYAFRYCGSLTGITIEATTPPRLGNNYVFADTNSCPIYVPLVSVNAYKNASLWTYFASRIEPIP